MASSSHTTKDIAEKNVMNVNVPTSHTSIGMYQILKHPHVTEKSSMLAGLNQYTFKVGMSATKIEIAQAIEKMYKVSVKRIHIIKIPAKVRMVGRTKGKRAAFKKAIVQLKEGDTLDVISQ